ncbi:MAG: sigma-54-dependent Fis family transcriptional regulator [Planctomycetes bacterium]|nr:sigma-54-dependent Fis family transcriptional regulator [Planctomycetota bacterium]
MSPVARHRVLLVEDDDSLRRVLGKELGRMGFTVEIHADGAGVAGIVERFEPHTVLLDMHLPETPGLDVLSQLHALEPRLPVVVFTGQGSVQAAVQAMQRGAFDFLQKPVALDVLEQTLRRAVAHAELQQENARLRRAAAHTAARSLDVQLPSEASQRLEQQVARVAVADQSVLIRGASGTGKEIVARRVHAGSERRQQPFVVVHCGAIPRQLVESELFGHVKGAFSGADQKRPGLFEAANGGTLFLDEVGELPLEVQPALLRALQFGEIRPVGSDHVRHVDVRFVAATHRDLLQAVGTGAFREDLYYRLAVLELTVAPLRERRADIEPLAVAFLQREAARAGRELRFAPSALARLQACDWPGNVRELENAVVRLAVLADGPEVTAADVDGASFGGQAAPPGALPTLELAKLEELAIDAALQRCHGNKTRAAAALGIALKTLYNKLNARIDEGT